MTGQEVEKFVDALLAKSVPFELRPPIRARLVPVILGVHGRMHEAAQVPELADLVVATNDEQKALLMRYVAAFGKATFCALVLAIVEAELLLHRLPHCAGGRQ